MTQLPLFSWAEVGPATYIHRHSDGMSVLVLNPNKVDWGYLLVAPEGRVFGGRFSFNLTRDEAMVEAQTAFLDALATGYFPR